MGLVVAWLALTSSVATADEPAPDTTSPAPPPGAGPTQPRDKPADATDPQGDATGTDGTANLTRVPVPSSEVTLPAPRRPLRGSFGAGGSLLLTGDRGDKARLDIAADLKPRSRFGVLVALRAFDEDHKGLLSGGVVFEAAAARPRLVLDLHADAGVDLDLTRPLFGGGVRTTLTVYAPIALLLDFGGLIVIDGLSGTRMQIYSSALLGIRF